jgi:ubiquinone/menaquinone biosynthesis C-methylase UbiE
MSGEERESPGTGMLPVRLSTSQVRRIYDRLAPTYDFWSTAFESRARERALELIVAGAGGRILEVAIGTGAAFARILRLNAEGLTVGLDLSQRMLSKADARSRRSAHGARLLLLADARHLPFASDSFDIVTNSYMLDLLPVEDIRGALSEYARVLKPGGSIVLINMTKSPTWLSRAWEWLYQRSPSLLGGCRGVLAVPFLEEMGLSDVRREEVRQLSFPSEVLVARKPGLPPSA